MGAVQIIGFLQVLAFLGAAVAATQQWHRQRTRAAAYLAGAFGAVGGALLVARTVEGPAPPWLSALIVGALAAFPWLLAAFAWSLDGPLPRWLRLAGLGVPALAVWAALLPPTVGATEPRTPAQNMFVTTLLLLWTLLAIAMAARLWRAGSRQRLVRARMRLMATGAVLVTLALLIGAATGPTSGPAVEATTGLLTLVSVALFVAGFAPPLPLRLWWRRRSSRQFQDMQVALIATASPDGVAEAIAPMLADLLGGGVAVVADDGAVLAASQLSEEQAGDLASRLTTGAPLPPGTSAYPVTSAWLVVRSTPYTPVFGQDELELVRAFSLHLRLALERAELYRTEQAAREEAQTARQELERTLYGLSHDLKSPTVAISGFVDLLPRTEDEAERDEILGHIRSSAEYLHRLVEDLLELSRVGRTQIEVEDVDLAALVEQVANRVRMSHPEATVRAIEPLPVVAMNAVRAEQLFDNLVTNAVRHGGREDIEVTVAAAFEEQGVTLSVGDNGHGIPDEERERIFELFQRGSTSRGRGSGVGLSMVQRIVEAYGGTLDLAEAAQGARFVVHLPGEVVVAPGPTVGNEPASPPA